MPDERRNWGTKMTEADKDMEVLDLFLAEVCETDPLPGDELMARILADAHAVMPAVPGLGTTIATSAPGGWRSLFATVGGWPAMGGIAFGMVAGVWIGMAPPERLNTIATGVLGETVTVQLMPDDDLFGLLEG